jgi:hypothetical protein
MNQSAQLRDARRKEAKRLKTDPLDHLPEVNVEPVYDQLARHHQQLRDALGDAPGELDRASELIMEAGRLLVLLRADARIDIDTLVTSEKRLCTEIGQLQKAKTHIRSMPDIERYLQGEIAERKIVLQELQDMHSGGKRTGSGTYIPARVILLLGEAFQAATLADARECRRRGQGFCNFVATFREAAIAAGMKELNADLVRNIRLAYDRG